ncbi:MAG: EthD domain-containing protein [bacterium]|nr:EthD domain-containing protein [bacterium]
MVKLIFCCRRRPELTPARYAELLLEGHVPLALRHHPTMRRYVVNVVEQVPAGFPAYDSVGELSFDTLEDYEQRLYDSDEGRRAIGRDVARFLAGADTYLTTEHVQRAPAPATPRGARSPGIKMLCPLRRRPDMTHEAFVAHWLGTHVPLALRHHPGMSRYVTSVVERRLGDTGEEWDGFAALHFPSDEAWRTGLFDSPEGERVVREDIARFIGTTGPYRVAEYVQR